MATRDVAKGLFFLFFSLWILTVCCSGTHVGFSFDARRGRAVTPTATETASFLKRNKVSPSQIRVFAAGLNLILDSLSHTGIPVDLHVNPPEEIHTQIKPRIRQLFVEMSLMGGLERRELGREEEQILPSSRRELINNPTLATKTTLHGLVTPITNPVTTPITTNPTPGIVTVPSTNPGTVLPMNPMTSSTPVVTVPSTNPVTNPIPVPATNPITTPITVPSTVPSTPPPAVVPVTNPVTTPATVPISPPFATNPVTIYPFPPPSNVPGTTPGVGITPVTVPVSPTAAGQSWCVAKTGALDAALQVALDYACGIGGADCSTIQQTGSCYNPNTIRDHASYAFNSYYQKNPLPTSCDFGGTAMVVGTNPSTGSCTYPSTSSGSSVLNTNNPTGPSNVFGSNNPTGSENPSSTTTTSNSLSLSAGLPLLFALISASLYISGNIRW